MYPILSHSFPILSPPLRERIGRRKSLKYKEIYIYYLILSPILPTPLAIFILLSVCVRARGGGKE